MTNVHFSSCRGGVVGETLHRAVIGRLAAGL